MVVRESVVLECKPYLVANHLAVVSVLDAAGLLLWEGVQVKTRHSEEAVTPSV
jgi:hypothetical protein